MQVQRTGGELGGCCLQVAGPISWSPLNLQAMPLRSTRRVPSAMPGTHQALRRCHLPLCAVYTASPGPGEAGSYSCHLQLWILVLEEPGVSPDQGMGLSRGVVSAFTGPGPYTLLALPTGLVPREVGSAPALPSPDIGLCLLLRLLLAPVLARTAVWLRAWQGACCPPPTTWQCLLACHPPYAPSVSPQLPLWPQVRAQPGAAGTRLSTFAGNRQSRLTPTLTWPALGASLGQAGQVNGIGLGLLSVCSPPQQQFEPGPGWAGILF